MLTGGNEPVNQVNTGNGKVTSGSGDLGLAKWEHFGSCLFDFWDDMEISAVPTGLDQLLRLSQR